MLDYTLLKLSIVICAMAMIVGPLAMVYPDAIYDIIFGYVAMAAIAGVLLLGIGIVLFFVRITKLWLTLDSATPPRDVSPGRQRPEKRAH